MTRDDYDRVWQHDADQETAEWEEAQRGARDTDADRFEADRDRAE